jgi:hypothetical protein
MIAVPLDGLNDLAACLVGIGVVPDGELHGHWLAPPSELPQPQPHSRHGLVDAHMDVLDGEDGDGQYDEDGDEQDQPAWHRLGAAAGAGAAAVAVVGVADD